MKIPKNSVGLRIMITRKRLGLNQKEIAEKANIKLQSYQRLERGQKIRGSYEYVKQIKEVLGFDFDDPELVAMIEKMGPEGCQQPSVDDNQLNLFGNV